METLNRALKTIPGLSLVFSIAALLMLEENSEVAAAIRVFVVAWLLYWISSSLDKLFDLAYGPKPEDRRPTFLSRHLGKAHRVAGRLWYRVRRNTLPGFKTLENNRNFAAEELPPHGASLGDHQPTLGVYVRAKERLPGEKWEEQIKPVLDRSKAARAFIAPFLLTAAITAVWKQHLSLSAQVVTRAGQLSQAHLLSGFKNDFMRVAERLDFLDPLWSLTLFLLCVVLYVWLRIVHMNKLYTLVSGKGARLPIP